MTIGLLAASGMALCGDALLAQKTRAVAPPDPYTGGDKGALGRAGYISYAPFSLGTNHTTLTAEEVLGTAPLIWIETDHFRLGCTLPAMKAKVREPWGKEWR
ncbi:MAG: hypothetical protein AB8H80_04290, partial [Planctomycetota bacterium]